MVTGSDCLDYINKPIGFANHDFTFFGDRTITDLADFYRNRLEGSNAPQAVFSEGTNIFTEIKKWSHDTNKRKIGLVLGESEQDGGLEIAILGNEDIKAVGGSNGNVEISCLRFKNSERVQYRSPVPFADYERTTQYTPYPNYQEGYPEYPTFYATENDRDIPYDNIFDFNPTPYSGYGCSWGCFAEYAGQPAPEAPYTLTTNKNNTLVYGKIKDILGIDFAYPSICVGNPLNLCAGDLYSYGITKHDEIYFSTPVTLPSDTNFDDINRPLPNCIELTRTNLTSLMFNIILTRNEQFALKYLNDGTLPSDAFLYPLDWDNLPEYDEPVPTGDKPDDYPDDNDPDDDDRDFDPTPPETPTFTVNQLTNYNWYWLTVPEWSAFISWFWNDIGDYSDFDDIIAKVKGLYNDVASAVIMCRYYPVDISWIGGLGTQSNIKLGMIEKAGAVDTISQATALHAVDIGHVHIGAKYKSFMDMSPYSQLSLYLPWHGFIDLDMNLFNGHEVYVKALYDYLSGTIQYYIYYDNELLVNTILCKMAMDIPITLQTKNDRDSAIFNNVSSTIGGLVGAGAGIISGNPIGMALGVTQGVGAFNSANASAPMRLMGNVGESGAYIGFQNCFVVVRRPTIQPSDGNSSTMKGLSTWKRNVGMLCGYGYTLSDLSGQGFTVCHSPRIDFTSTTPLQTEVDEIYSYLEKGVIL
jgi:hypothetical protein